MTVIILVLSDL